MIEPGEMAAVLRRAAARVVVDLEETITITMERAREIATEQIGKDKPNWEPLAPATYARGSEGPLLRSGVMRDGLEVRHRGLEGALVSTEPYIVYSEYGTAREPPRPLLQWAVREAVRDFGMTRLRFTLTRVLG